jgi:hypothetical protein
VLTSLLGSCAAGRRQAAMAAGSDQGCGFGVHLLRTPHDMYEGEAIVA